MTGRIFAIILTSCLANTTTAVVIDDDGSQMPEPHATTTPNQVRHGDVSPASCPQCHEDSIRASHPVDFKPSRSLPATFPLDSEGYMTCLTCHETREQDIALRSDRTTLCASCHDQTFFAGMADAGISLSFSGHFNTDNRYASESMDPYSLQCASCHDDEINGAGQHSSQVANHTVGTDYDAAYEYGGYRSRETLAESVYLPDNRISCVSCHKAYSSEHGVLISVVEKRDFCYTCHDI